KFLSFMRSYPNLIPLSAKQVTGIAVALEPFQFDTIYGHYPFANNTGVLTKHTPAIDVDIENEEAAKAVEALATVRRLALHRREGTRAGNPAGRLPGSRNRLSEEVICALLRDFRQHGQKAVARVRQTQPAAYLKILALLIPREHKVEHSNLLKELSDEQLEAMIAHLETSLAAQAGAPAKMIEGTIEP